MSGEEQTKTISVTTIKWITGIGITLLLFGVVSFRSDSASASTRAAEIEVLKVRVESLEGSAARVSELTQQIARSVNQLSSDQAAFQARIEVRLESMRFQSPVVASQPPAPPDTERRRSRTGSP
jgi:hypothetical protein